MYSLKASKNPIRDESNTPPRVMKYSLSLLLLFFFPLNSVYERILFVESVQVIKWIRLAVLNLF